MGWLVCLHAWHLFSSQLCATTFYCWVVCLSFLSICLLYWHAFLSYRPSSWHFLSLSPFHAGMPVLVTGYSGLFSLPFTACAVWHSTVSMPAHGARFVRARLAPTFLPRTSRPPACFIYAARHLLVAFHLLRAVVAFPVAAALWCDVPL